MATATPKKTSLNGKLLTHIIDRIKKRNNTYAIETGKDLLNAKSLLKHGEFGPWLKSNFGWSTSTAQNYMNAAKLAEQHPIVENLQSAAVTALAAPSTPDVVKSEVIADLENGHVPAPKEIKAKIAAAKPKAQTAAQAPDPFNELLIQLGKQLMDADISADSKIELLTAVLADRGYSITAVMHEAA